MPLCKPTSRSENIWLNNYQGVIRMKFITALAGLFKKTATASNPPPIEEKHPGHGYAADPENVSVSRILETVLRQEGFDARLSDGSVVLSSGIRLSVELLETVNFGENRIRTSTRIVASHDSCFPNGLPEFQHAAGQTAGQALADGFSTWAKMDLVTLEDSTRTKPRDCSVMEMGFPSESKESAKVRQVILGPVGRMVSSSAQTEEEHPFCPCCMITQNFDAFRGLLQSDRLVGIRLFASRDADGNLAADCRVNGEDFPEGVEHLVNYARSWPERGFEFRKQYVVVRSAGVTRTPQPA